MAITPQKINPCHGGEAQQLYVVPPNKTEEGHLRRVGASKHRSPPRHLVLDMNDGISFGRLYRTSVSKTAEPSVVAEHVYKPRKLLSFFDSIPLRLYPDSIL